MNREIKRVIKFRAWDKKKYIEIGGGKQKHLNGIMRDDFVVKDGVCYFEDSEDGLIKKDWILMQFTGLKDKNGKMIFEGDIVKGMNEHKGQSEVFIDGITVQPFNYLNDPEGKHFEVIGNIYENKDLLK